MTWKVSRLLVIPFLSRFELALPGAVTAIDFSFSRSEHRSKQGCCELRDSDTAASHWWSCLWLSLLLEFWLASCCRPCKPLGKQPGECSVRTISSRLVWRR